MRVGEDDQLVTAEEVHEAIREHVEPHAPDEWLATPAEERRPRVRPLSDALPDTYPLGDASKTGTPNAVTCKHAAQSTGACR